MSSTNQPMDLDIRKPVTIDFTDGAGTGNGNTSIILTPREIDWEAEEFYGYSHCGYLAGAMASMTGWKTVVSTGTPPHVGHEVHVHTGLHTPDGKVLDIFGLHPTVEEWRGSVQSKLSYPVNVHENVPCADMPKVYGESPETIVGGDRWWCDQPDELINAHQHFARLVLNKNGYGQHIPPEAQSKFYKNNRPVPQETAPQKPAGAPTGAPATKGSAMNIEELRGAIQQAQQQIQEMAQRLAGTAEELEQVVAQLTQIVQGTGDTTMSDGVTNLQGLLEELRQAPARLHHSSETFAEYTGRL